MAESWNFIIYSRNSANGTPYYTPPLFEYLLNKWKVNASFDDPHEIIMIQEHDFCFYTFTNTSKVSARDLFLIVKFIFISAINIFS